MKQILQNFSWDALGEAQWWIMLIGLMLVIGLTKWLMDRIP